MSFNGKHLSLEDRKIIEAKPDKAYLTLESYATKDDVSTAIAEADISSKLENYYTNIHNVALFDYNQIGDEFQSAMTENSTRREYMDREKLFVGVAAFQQSI